MTAILSSSVRCKTLVDGTLQITVNVEPNHAQEAFALFGMPGAPMAIARLTQGASIAAMQAEQLRASPERQEPERPKAKGGPLAKLAGTLCNNPQFIEWLGVKDDAGAAEFIRIECGIDSRAELDDSPTAARIFHEAIRLPFLNRGDVG